MMNYWLKAGNGYPINDSHKYMLLCDRRAGERKIAGMITKRLNDYWGPCKLVLCYGIIIKERVTNAEIKKGSEINVGKIGMIQNYKIITSKNMVIASSEWSFGMLQTR